MKVSVGFLGGVGEIGMNMYVYETENAAVIVDCGVKFAGATEPGVDLIIPDFSYLETIRGKLKCVILTHAHEDHAGALTFLLGEYQIPLVAGRFSMDLAEYKLKARDVSIEKIYLEYGIDFEAGDFTVSLIPVSHSIPGTGALFIKAADGFTVLHMSDYKIDFAPVSGNAFSLNPFLEIGDAGLCCLVADSTNALSGGFTRSEKNIVPGLEEIFQESAGRIFFTTFASNSERIGTVLTLAEKYGRKVALEGASLSRNIEVARRNGLLRISPDAIIPRKQIERLADNEICVIATGSQGEATSVVSKIAKNDYSNIAVRETDTFLFSSRIIPGNEQNIITVMNNIAFLGGKCVTVADNANVHTSGHACAEDMKLLLKLVRPSYLIPVHGEYMHLRRHKEIAESEGMDRESIIIGHSGSKAVFDDGVFIGLEDIIWGKRFIDAKSGFILSVDDAKDRKRLAFEGGVFVHAYVDLAKGVLIKAPVVSALGFPLDDSASGSVVAFLSHTCEVELFERFIKEGWSDFVTKAVKRYFKKNMGRRPLISVIIEEIQ